jgi:hypothetical protein
LAEAITVYAPGVATGVRVGKPMWLPVCSWSNFPWKSKRFRRVLKQTS